MTKFLKNPLLLKDGENMAQQIPPDVTKSPKNAPEDIKG